MERVLDMIFMDKNLSSIWEKVKSETRLSFEDGMTLFRTHDPIGLGKIADFAKRQKSEDYVYFVLNRQINPTNICVLACKFCNFSTKKGQPNAYEMTIEEILARCQGVREVHIVGSLHPDWPFEYYIEMVRTIKEAYPDVQIKAFTAIEIDHFARIADISIEEVLSRLKAARVVSLPGGGAEVFSERVKKELFPAKIGEERWLQIHKIAHSMGIPSNATMLYGHIETYEERVNHLLKLRALQEETHGFLAFIPLAFQPGTTNIVTRQATAIEDLKTIAVARLLLDNFPHIKAYWVMLGEETASIALNFGADDMDGTIGEERIAHAALAKSPVGLARDSILSLIREAGKIPVERDALYNVVRVYE